MTAQVTIGGRLISQPEQAALEGALDMATDCHHGLVSRIAMEYLGDIRARVPAEAWGKAMRYMRKAEEAILAGRPRLPLGEVSAACMLQQGLLYLLNNQDEKWQEINGLLVARGLEEGGRANRHGRETE